MYNPEIKGAAESREIVQFLSGLMNDIHDVSDTDFAKTVDTLEKSLAALLPNADPATVAWTIYTLGHMEGGHDPMRGLFWSALGDALITREETREMLGEESMPRPKPAVDGEACPSCETVHPDNLEERMQAFKELVPELRQAAEAVKAQRAKEAEMHQPGMREALEGDPKAILRMLGMPEELLDHMEIEVVALPPGASKADMLREIAAREAEHEKKDLDKQVEEVTGGAELDFDKFMREVTGGTPDNTEENPEGNETPPTS